MSIDNLFKGTAASLFNRHPNGKFNAVVTGLVKSKTQSGKDLVKIEMQSAEGKLPDYNIFLVTETDALVAETNADVRDRLIKSIQINKGVLVKLGLATEVEAKAMGQNDMLKAYVGLKDKKVIVKVEDDQKDPKYQRVTLESIITSNTPPALPSSNLFDTIPTSNLDTIPF